jgi:hypothetical protein
MKLRSKFPIWILFFSMVCIFSVNAEDTKLPINLEKNWRVYPGDAFADKAFEQEKAGTWIDLPSLPIATIKEQLDQNNDPIARATACTTVNLTEGFIKSLSKELISIHIAYAPRVNKVYLNGNLVQAYGEIHDHRIIKSGNVRNQVDILPLNFLKNGDNEICIALYSYPKEDYDIYASQNSMNTEIDYYFNHEYQLSERVTLMLDFLYLAVGLYHLLLFFKRPAERYNLHFGLFCVLLSFYIFTRSKTVYDTGLDPYLIMQIEYIIVFQLPSQLALFTEYLFFGKARKVISYYTVFVSALCLAVIAFDYMVAIKVLTIWQISMLGIIVYVVYNIIVAIRAGNPDAKRLILGSIFLVVSVVLDLLGAMLGGAGGEKNLGLMRYGFFFFVMGIAVILANRFLRVYSEVEELNTNLEKKVEVRTRELQATLTEVKALKEKQDGDYFLTSLLLKPLGSNRAKSPACKIDFFVQQKKEFEFKGKNYEIGGDICIADNLKFNDKNYSVFVNGDAMGKSIQGAGGALVLGVVFQSVIARTQLKGSQGMSPERWLKECFLELHTVFESFNGSMLISVVIGLVDDETGLMYFINAEHPWTALYRDGKASFLENDLELRKIGTIGMEGDIRVKTFQLLEGDMIILGSDGRDDLLIPTTDGSRLMNEDETLFLRRIEEGNGDLKQIVKGIKDFGEVSDDLTLLKIEFSPVTSPKWEGNKEKEAKAEEIRKLLKAKNFDKAASLSEEFTNEYPQEVEFFYFASLAYKMSHNYSKAADFGETFRLREPANVNNLLNLADTYRLMGIEKRCIKLMEKVKKYDPSNPFLEKLGSMLKNKSEMIEELNRT